MSDGDRSCGAKHTSVFQPSWSRRVGERINNTDAEDVKSLFIMGEDRVTFGERKNGDVLSSRQRHSSVISSCSEESETTSTGYPPTPEEEKEEELEYGPGIVNKLRTKFLSISLKQNRGTIRRSCSMENLLDQDRPSRSNIFSQNVFDANNKETEEHNNTIWGNLKRAKSMDTLLMDLKQESSCMSLKTDVNGDIKKEPKIVRRRDGGLNRTGPTICDEELPKPDTVKTYKRMFEPAESRRGSYSRKPPVLRASAKSGSLSVSKINGVSPSAKVNGIVLKNKLSAKPSSPVKAQPDSEKISNIVSNQPIVNGDESKSLCNGNYVKATPVKIADNSLCNGKVEKPLENEVNGLDVSKKILHNNQKNSVVSNGSPTLKELIKTESNESYVKPDVKKLVNQTYKAVNGSDKPVTHVLNGLNQKPKVPPNRPTFIRNAKPVLKVADLKGIDKKSPMIPKLKPIPTSIHKKPQDLLKPESENIIEQTVISDNTKLNDEVVKEPKEKEVKPLEVIEENNINEENDKKIPEKVETEISDVITLEKTDLTPQKVAEKEIVNQVNGDVVDSEKLTNNQKVEPADIKPESKPIKKQQSSEPVTTSMVFDFRGKDVVPHVAVLPVPFGCKALHPKKKSLLIDGKETVNGNGIASEDEDEYRVDYSVPPPSGVVFVGENIKIGKGSILAVRNKDLKIKFDDNVDDNTFVYPSETSLLEESDLSLSPSPPPNEVIPNGQPPPSKLKNNPAMGSSGAGGLSTYTPSVLRTMDNFEPGMFRPPPALPEKDDDKNILSGEEENTEVRQDCQEKQDMLKPADPGIISSWSLSAGTSDLLF